MAKTSTTLVAILAVSLVTLVVLLINAKIEFARLSSEVRFSNDIITSFDDKVAYARKHDTKEAANYLMRLHASSLMQGESNQPFHGYVALLVGNQRTRAVWDIIRDLKLKTGEDLGTDPEKWILKYADDDLKRDLQLLKQIQ